MTDLTDITGVIAHLVDTRSEREWIHRSVKIMGNLFIPSVVVEELIFAEFLKANASKNWS